MTALELVQGATVKKVSRKVGSALVGPSMGRRAPAVAYDVTVALPDEAEVRLSASSATAWRRVVKKAGLKLISKAAKAAAAELRDRIAVAVAAERASPTAALLDAKVMDRARKSEQRRVDLALREQRMRNLERMRELMMETRVSKEELLELWNSSVLADVMRA